MANSSTSTVPPTHSTRFSGKFNVLELMHVCCSVVRKLKVTAGRAVPFGPGDIVLINRRKQPALRLQKSALRQAIFELRSKPASHILRNQLRALLRRIVRRGERLLPRFNRAELVPNARQFAADVRFQLPTG